MTSSLRINHFFIWCMIATLLPAAFILALMFRPKAKIKHSLTEDFSIRITERPGASALVFIELKNPLRTPSCVVYIETKMGKIILGMLSGTGTYTFEAPSGGDNIILMDNIHHRMITSRKIFHKK